VFFAMVLGSAEACFWRLPLSGLAGGDEVRGTRRLAIVGSPAWGGFFFFPPEYRQEPGSCLVQI